ncbi:GNAT family N-acetyltransferase [Cellulomonas shaoxiangyii]|uniref:GNAT family N-acetyltransferase n=1 Tax=Cellulomonas shaoxiangyii TaxID=2566013 RepID=A0A4P7SFW1_9CELL|nr:GNAT family N-acetyltransferase [Cellulomonas shaoxiangyii]QCB92451.1 GNAT family N-acetyltransferase [Cellulomonas shaoxiangyii]TGY85654.1 GNAT family N-acetyltransferase [Cellulomonas shaoxiangyii]
MTAPLALTWSAWDDLTPTQAYDVLRLRVDVFVVEQRCAYPEIDGRDLEEGARHLRATREGRVVGYLRLLEDGATEGTPARARIGRLCVAQSARNTGVASRLMRAAVAAADGREQVLDAQAHLESWYARFGFAAASDVYSEDGIPHVTMVRPAA